MSACGRVAEFKLNPDVARYLQEQLKDRTKKPLSTSLYPHQDSRLTTSQRQAAGNSACLVAAFKAGTPKHILAEEYGINIKSIKQLLREEDVKKRSRYDKLV